LKDRRKQIFVKEAKKCLTYVKDYYIFPNNSTKEDSSMIATQMLAMVETQRLQKAVEGLVSGAYTITVTSQGEAEIRSFVANGDGKEYGVVLSGGQAFCSCKDAVYRHGICKHAVALALYTIRTPQAEAKAEPKPYNLTLAKVRPGAVLA
jgi:predicted nucleic acid-binding Zn finger protein